MLRSIVFCALGVVPLGVACDNSGADVHGEAGKADVVPSDFAKIRDDYRHQKQADLAVLDKTITDLEAKEKAAAAKTKPEIAGRVSSIKAERDTFMGDLRATENAGAATWESTKMRLDKEWGELKTATDEAASSAVSALSSTHKPGEMTCEDFVALADVERPKIIYWAEGFNRKGKPVDAVVDVRETDKLVPVLVAECAKSPKQPLSQVIQHHDSIPLKPMAAAPQPAKMSCEEFLAVEDVVQPKLVYWAAGFNKDGGATDSVVDITETDRIVPVLVKECKEAPKLTLWQKIKKYF